ncbi:MAG: DNA repair protein RecO [Desulfobacterales bacterium]|nr:MAG: DNA repair protein RecO [Desulfobacterales bacterium]
MPVFTTPAILLRRVDFGDWDLIVSFFSLARGKISLIAKSAKRSTKRFAGILELFSVLDVVGQTSRGRGLSVLQEAVLKEPFSRIRADIRKTAYASYWAELTQDWMEENAPQAPLFYLLRYVLHALDRGHASEETLSILFQVRFLTLSGHSPNLGGCGVCRKDLEQLNQPKVIFDLVRGGIVCAGCASSAGERIALAKGTIKQLLWMEKGDLAKAARIRFGPQAMQESLDLLENFGPYHLGKPPRSLKFLRQIRKANRWRLKG